MDAHRERGIARARLVGKRVGTQAKASPRIVHHRARWADIRTRESLAQADDELAQRGACGNADVGEPVARGDPALRRERQELLRGRRQLPQLAFRTDDEHAVVRSVEQTG